MKECDLCGEEVPRRKRCWHCGCFVCGYCWHHNCACEPNHTRQECKDLKHINEIKQVGGPKAVKLHLDALRKYEMSLQ